MNRRTNKTVPELIADLSSGEVEARLVAAVDLRWMGSDALPAVPALIAALDDEGVVRRESLDFYGGMVRSWHSYVANEALITLKKLAAQVPADHIARTIARLDGRPTGVDGLGNEDSWLGYGPRTVSAFGPPLVAALRLLAADGADGLRSGASAILARLDSNSDTNVRKPDD
jgi:HEAT repeat protein